MQGRRANIGFWQTAVKIKKGRGTPGRKLRTLYARMEEEYKKDIRDISLNKAIRIKKKAERDLEEISKTHIEAREKWKMELSEAKVRTNKKSTAVEYKKTNGKGDTKKCKQSNQSSNPQKQGARNKTSTSTRGLGQRQEHAENA